MHDLELFFQHVVAAFGPGVVGVDGRIDRPQLRALIFGDAAKRRQLDRITHPVILWQMAMQVRVRALRGGLSVQVLHQRYVRRRLVVLDAPLLFETGLHRMCSTILVVCDG